MISGWSLAKWAAMRLSVGVAIAVALSSLPLTSVAGAEHSSRPVSATSRPLLPCTNLPASTRVKSYRQVALLGSVPLRCGQYVDGRGWGLAKMTGKDRTDIWFDSMISTTLQSPFRVVQEGTRYVYRSRWLAGAERDYRFIVVADTRLKDGKVMGIVSAFREFRCEHAGADLIS